MTARSLKEGNNYLMVFLKKEKETRHFFKMGINLNKTAIDLAWGD